MPALNFQKRFADFVTEGVKRHSIRARRKRPWKIGDEIALYTGMRHKSCRLLGRSEVVKVESILLVKDPMLRISIDGNWLSNDEKQAFARADGFGDVAEMAEFWMAHHDLHIVGHWHGEVIHWRFPFATKERAA